MDLVSSQTISTISRHTLVSPCWNFQSHRGCLSPVEALLLPPVMDQRWMKLTVPPLCLWNFQTDGEADTSAKFLPWKSSVNGANYFNWPPPYRATRSTCFAPWGKWSISCSPLHKSTKVLKCADAMLTTKQGKPRKECVHSEHSAHASSSITDGLKEKSYWLTLTTPSAMWMSWIRLQGHTLWKALDVEGQ